MFMWSFGPLGLADHVRHGKVPGKSLALEDDLERFASAVGNAYLLLYAPTCMHISVDTYTCTCTYAHVLMHACRVAADSALSCHTALNWAVR